MLKKSESIGLWVLIAILWTILFVPHCVSGASKDSSIVVWAATGGGVSRTTDGGKTWVNHFLGEGKNVHSVAVDGGQVWAGTEQGVCKSIDGGKTWTTYDSDDGLPSYHLESFKDHIVVSSVCVETDSAVWIGCRYLPGRANTLGKSEDGGKTWKLFELNKGRIGYEISSIVSSGGNVWVGALGTRAYSSKTDPEYKYGGLYRTTDGGKTWTVFTTDNGLSGNVVRSLYLHNGCIYVLTNRGIDVTEDDGITWESSAPGQFHASNRVRYPGALYVADDRNIYAAHDNQLSVTRDAGKTWKGIDFEGAVEATGWMTSLNSILVVGGELWLGATIRDPEDNPVGGVLKSVDGGKTWTVYTVDDGVGGCVYALAVER